MSKRNSKTEEITTPKRSIICVYLPVPCTCAARSYAHFHSEQIEEYDRAWHRAYGIKKQKEQPA